MNEEIDDSEFHQDFTTASEWEVFIARMEEVIHGWKLQESAKNGDSCIIHSEKIPFADVEFEFLHYKKVGDVPEVDDEQVKNPIDTNYDFKLDTGSRTSEVLPSVWYGLNEYYLLMPSGSSGITSESRIKILLSSAHIAASNTNCSVPIFVQIRDKWQNCYLGVYEGESVRTNFEMVHLRRSPQHCQYLSGLLDLFKTKIMSPVSLDPVSVSVQITYVLNEFGVFNWKQDLLSTDIENVDSSILCSLPFGVTVDPILILVMKASWSYLPEHFIVDTENYSDFNAMQAQRWSLLPKMTGQPLCLLSDCLSEFLLIFNNSLSMYDILGDFAVPPSESTNPLDLLTESKVPTISSVLKRAARNSVIKNRRGVAPLAEEVLGPMLYFLFPDAEDTPTFSYSEKTKDRNTCEENELDDQLNLEELWRGLKTCSFDSLVWRLATVLAQSLHSFGGNRALAHIWYEFSQEMRYRWEKTISIPGLELGFPDPRTCLLHQKLQMLNCCIERRRARESSLGSSGTYNFESAEDSSTEDEEFFDCNEKTSEESIRKKQKLSLWNQPVGRLGKFDNLKLLKTGDEMYVPATQEPVPKTEDQLEEDADVLMKLGSDAQGSELRARMMSASLLSDMESFKAANPGSVLEDFIRWYSPRDWIEEEGVDEWGQQKGRLSSRMLISDNTWVQVWESAKPVPAHRQRRLFDDTREAEKVLHFLDSRNLAQIAEMITPVLAQAAVYTLIQEWQQVSKELPELMSSITQLTKTVEKLSREATPSSRRFELFIQEVTSLELLMSQAKSLLYKFSPTGEVDESISSAVADLVKCHEIEIVDKTDSKIATRMLEMFLVQQRMTTLMMDPSVGSLDDNVFPQPTEREFVMRVAAARPAAYSTKCPQFLRAILSKGDFRLAGAFSEDIVFF